MKPTGRSVTVAVIDSGIDPCISDLERHVAKKTGFAVIDGYIREDGDMDPRHEHASAIAMIIRQLCPVVQFISINILGEDLTTDGRVLITAIEHALEESPDIIHMSLGTTRYKRTLQKLVESSSDKGVLLVSAVNNCATKSYPASCKGVLAVKGSEQIGGSDYCYDGRFFYAPLTMAGIAGREELQNPNPIGNSFAAAYLTGHIARIISEQGPVTYQGVLRELEKNVKKTINIIDKELSNGCQRNC